MLWLLLLPVLAGVVGFAVWDYRKKAAARAAASQSRFEEIFKGPAAAAAASPDSVPPFRPSATVAVSPVPQASTAIAAVRAGDRFLGPAAAAIYHELRAGLPDHEVFANVMLASLVSPSGSGRDREQQLRRLSQYQVDFVVCDRELRIVAAVEIEAASSAEAVGMRRFQADCLKAAGIRLVRIDAAAVPRGNAIRALVGLEAPRRSVP